MGKVNVYKDDEIIAQVEYNANLDMCDGSKWYNGGQGKHLGITKLENGMYVLIHGSDWQGESDYAEVVSKERALHEILSSGNGQMTEREGFEDLKEMVMAFPKEISLE